MLYDYLTDHYAINEPIFLSDVHLPGITNNYLRQMFKQLCDSGKLRRFHAGVYYLVASDIDLRNNSIAPFSPKMVAEYKYIHNTSAVYGYYVGQTFAFQLGLLSTPADALEIVSNHTSGKYRELSLDDIKIILRKPKFPITNANWKVLQLLDFLKDIELYINGEHELSKRIIQNYILENQITREDIAPYVTEYPDKLYRIIYELELYDVLKGTQRNSFVSSYLQETLSKSTSAKRRRELSVELL